MPNYPQYMSAKRLLEYRRKQKALVVQRRKDLYKTVRSVKNEYGSLLSKKALPKRK